MGVLYPGAAAATPRLSHSCCICCRRMGTTAPWLQLTAAYPHPVTNQGAMKVLHPSAAAAAAAAERLHLSCITHAVVFASARLPLHTGCSLL